MFAVYDVKPADRAQIDAALKDDQVSRQSIAVREAAALGLSGGTLVLIEGEEAAVRRSHDLFAFATRLEGTKADEARQRFKAQDEDVASGVGLIFGG